MHIGSRVFNVTRPQSGVFDQWIDSNRVKVVFDQEIGSSSVNWSVQIKLAQPTTPGAAETIWIEFSNGVNTTRNVSVNGFVFWDSSIRVGFAEGSQTLPLKEYYQYSLNCVCVIYNAFTSEVISTSDMPYIATGLAFVQKYDNAFDGESKIYNIEYTVLYGDVAGNGVIGDCMINVSDSLAVLQHVAQTSMINGALLQLAADVDHDGSITNNDAQIILGYSVGMGTIVQSYCPPVPDDVCFGVNSVVFA